MRRAAWRALGRWPSRCFPILSACRVEAAGLEVWTTEISQSKHTRGMWHILAVTAAYLGTVLTHRFCFSQVISESRVLIIPSHRLRHRIILGIRL